MKEVGKDCVTIKGDLDGKLNIQVAGKTLWITIRYDEDDGGTSISSIFVDSNDFFQSVRVLAEWREV